jgi:signal transduction histidine kinase
VAAATPPVRFVSAMARRSRRADSGQTILVVDDQDDTLASVRALLEREGHRVLTASSGPEALAIVETTDVQLVIVDYFMPRMTGAELVHRIRRCDPYLQIVLQTGYAGEKPPREVLAQLDIQGYHDKTDDPDRLLLWVDVALKAGRLLRDLRDRERLQSELVANCSHEFRTPLNIIGGYIELLRSGDFGRLPAETETPLGAIAEATRTLTELVTDFLSYAKLEARVTAVDVEAVAIPTLVAELDRLGQVLVEEKEVRFRVDAARAPAAVTSDPVKLRTILRNLVGNAVKFTARGEIVLGIAAGDGIVRFAVRDSGCGIPISDLDLVFEPFRQGDGSATRRYGGVGLGLALARKMARLLGGELTVESEVDVGSTFTLVLPAGAAAAPAADALAP